MSKLEEKVIALAAVAQSCKQVRSIATSGYFDTDLLTTAVESILKTQPKSTLDIYGKKSALFSGFQIIKQYNLNTQNSDLELTKLIILTLSLSKKILKRNDLLDKLDSGIKQAQKQSEHFGIIHENVIANLAGLYKETVSTMNPKIMVSGNPVYLEGVGNADKVRTFLLSAVRSGVLWHQLGGSKWQLLFQRKKYALTASELLKIN